MLEDKVQERCCWRIAKGLPIRAVMPFPFELGTSIRQQVQDTYKIQSRIVIFTRILNLPLNYKTSTKEAR